MNTQAEPEAEIKRRSVAGQQGQVLPRRFVFHPEAKKSSLGNSPRGRTDSKYTKTQEEEVESGFRSVPALQGMIALRIMSEGLRCSPWSPSPSVRCLRDDARGEKSLRFGSLWIKIHLNRFHWSTRRVRRGNWKKTWLPFHPFHISWFFISDSSSFTSKNEGKQVNWEESGSCWC